MLKEMELFRSLPLLSPIMTPSRALSASFFGLAVKNIGRSVLKAVRRIHTMPELCCQELGWSCKSQTIFLAPFRRGEDYFHLSGERWKQKAAHVEQNSELKSVGLCI